MTAPLETACTVARVELGVLATVVQAAYQVVPDPCGLMLADTFTMLELRALHESVLGSELDRHHFQRIMAPQLVATDERAAGRVGKPARLFRKP